MINKGILAENIIVFSYDDVASSNNNPFPGKLFNRPDGEDVYAGCVIDYRGADVTPANFLAVLEGDAAAMSGKGSGKVLKSTTDDHVFINFSDHGAPGLIAFPSQYLYADALKATLEKMYSAGLYGELTFYLEACESGSMFDGKLSDQLNIYATTAANPTESSWGYYCYPDDSVQGTHIGSCLGDLYSIVWMEDCDAKDLCQETIGE
jgi:legumain